MNRCEGCPFKWGKLVGGRGDPGSSLVIVGESPGRNEILHNIPFCGPSGDVLDAALAPFPSLNPYILNAHICFPGSTTSKTEEKTLSAARCCSQRLHKEIQPGTGVQRKVILAMGNAALLGVLGNAYKSTQVRGKVFPSPLSRYGVVAAVHPSYLLRGGGSFRQFKADVHYACSLASGRGRYRDYILPRIHVWSSEQEIQRFARSLGPEDIVAADTETGGYEGFDHLRDRVLCSGFCVDPNLVYVAPAELTPNTRHLFDSPARFVWHNGKFDAKFFRAAGVYNVRVDEDTMLLSYALDESKGVHDLEQISSDILGMPDWKSMITPSLAAAKNSHPKGYKVTYADIPLDILYDYMSRDISATRQVYPVLRDMVRADKHLERLYTRVLIPTSEYLVWIEEAGMHLDLTVVDANETRLNQEVDKYRGIIDAAGRARGLGETNPNSPQQLATLLYDVLKLTPVERRHKPTRSTDEASLDQLDPENPVVIALKRYRKVKKAQSTYVTAAKNHEDSKGKWVEGWVNPVTGRVHTTYKIHGTATGRLASEDPNLLNIPRDPLLRGQFVASDGHVFLEVDTNQAELRVLAELSGDPELTRIYTSTGLSIHDEVRQELFGDPTLYDRPTLEFYLDKFNVRHLGEDKWLKELKAEQKMKAKNVNFGIPYGITAFGLAEQIDDTPKTAQLYLDRWYKKFAGARVFLLKCREAVHQNKVFVTPFGRKRRFGVVGPEILHEQQNQMSNFPMQSIASDIVLVTGIHMAPRVRKYNVRIVNTVYDSILFELPLDIPLIQDVAEETSTQLGVKAKEWGIRNIPITGEGKVGKRWGQLKPLEEWLPEHINLQQAAE